MNWKRRIVLATAGIAIGCGLYLITTLAYSPGGSSDAGKAPGAYAAMDRDLLEHVRAATVFVQSSGVSHLDNTDVTKGSGTGFLVSADGKIATNWHVVALKREVAGLPVPLKKKNITVLLNSGTAHQEPLAARVIAADPASDLAILKIDAEECPSLPLGNSDELVETAPVWVFGFPFGNLFTVLQRGPAISVNRGFVTSLRRNDRGTLEGIQFDAAINKGNSGGPLVLPDGKAYGIANIAIGNTRVNFAVPANRIRALLRDCPDDAEPGHTYTISVRSEPRARAWLGGDVLGTTPATAAVTGGHRRLVLEAPGYRTVTRWINIREDAAVSEKLHPLIRVTLKTGPSRKWTGPDATAMVRGETVFSEDFTSSNAESWRQYTGGDDTTRTWYVQDGRLHQFNPDGVLHAIFCDTAPWEDHCFAARVRIDKNDKDGRAGLIFRASDEGFAVYRLFRETNKVQLAWHSRYPFGWRFLAERKLAADIAGDRWYEMEVQTRDGHIACLLDGTVVLTAAAESIPPGGIGFYSVDSRAAFDDAMVTRTAPTRVRSAAPLSLLRFWFTEHFREDSGCWQAYEDYSPAPPWPVLRGGCLQNREDGGTRMNILEKYDIHDGTILSLLSVRKGAAGIVFRRGGTGGYYFSINRDTGRGALLILRPEKPPVRLGSGPVDPPNTIRDLLGSSTSPPSTEGFGQGDLFRLQLTIAGDAIAVSVNGTRLLAVKDKTFAHGNIGFFTRKAKAIFHTITVASLPVTEQD